MIQQRRIPAVAIRAARMAGTMVYGAGLRKADRSLDSIRAATGSARLAA